MKQSVGYGSMPPALPPTRLYLCVCYEAEHWLWAQAACAAAHSTVLVLVCVLWSRALARAGAQAACAAAHSTLLVLRHRDKVVTVAGSGVRGPAA